MTGTAVEQVKAQDLQARHVLNRTLATADILAASSLLRADLRGKPEDVRAIALTLHQYGLPVGIQNLNACYVVKGRVEFETRMWTALAMSYGGHRVWLDEGNSAEQATAWIERADSGARYCATFTMDDARRAGLAESETYRKYPQDMLGWRALSRVIKRYAPEVIAGLADAGEQTVARPRPRPLPTDQPPADDDIIDGEIVEQGEDVVLTGHATVAPPGPGAEADDEELAAYIRWKRAGKPRDENGLIIDVPPATEEPKRGQDNAAAEVVEPQTAPAPSGPVPGEWRARAVEQGKGDALLLKKAREFAAERGVEGAALPRTLDQVTDPADIARLEDWIG